MQQLPVQRLDAMPLERWRNGKGVTRTLARNGDDWRVSVAEIGQDGPYSRFEDMVRLSMVLSGDGIVLEAHGTVVRLEPMKPVRFDGSTAWHAALVGRPVTALNVMARRNRVRPQVRTVEGRIDVPGDGSVVVIALDTGCVVSGSASDLTLAPGEFLVLNDAPGHFQLSLPSTGNRDISGQPGIRLPIVVTLQADHRPG